MDFRLTRHAHEPVMLPDPSSEWECYNVFNPSVIHREGLFHMHYRAQGLDWISRIGYAVSVDGVHWNRLRHPVLSPQEPAEALGVEDPRVVELDGTFYMTYTAFGRASGSPTVAGGCITPMIARSDNLLSWRRIGSLTCGNDNKDHVLFPRCIGGRYMALHRPRPKVWLAESTDLVSWPKERMRELFGPRENSWWENTCVGANGVPLETEEGWLLLYHAYDSDHTYRFGVALLDLDDPGKVIRRPREPIFWPEEAWELRGDTPNVVFSNGSVVVGDTLYVYYGGADHAIGLATAPFKDVLHFATYG